MKTLTKMMLLGTIDHIWTENWPAWLKRRTTALYTGIFLAVETLVIALGCWGLCDQELVLRDVARTLPLVISSAQMILSFVSLALKSRNISQVLDEVQLLIDKRKSFIFQ